MSKHLVLEKLKMTIVKPELLIVTALIMLAPLFAYAETEVDVHEGKGRHWPPVPRLTQVECGPLKTFGRHGPYDYRNPPPEAIIDNVEYNHFNGHFAAMIRGKDEYFGPGGGRVAAGFGYTLHAFPNHHRALKAMDDYSRRRNFSERLLGAEYRIECYFERALRFRPNDVIARYLYVNYLEGRKRRSDADRELMLIAREAKEMPQLAYNIGLLYAQRGDSEKALEYARVAYLQGIVFPGLRAMLVRQGKWDSSIDETRKPLADSVSKSTVVEEREQR